MSELKPCPKCHNVGEVWEKSIKELSEKKIQHVYVFYYVQCTYWKCNYKTKEIQSKTSYYHKDNEEAKKKAITAWNTRKGELYVASVE